MLGRCLCGAVGFEIDLPVVSCVHCHCESCRRQCSAPFTTYVGVADGRWRWTSREPRPYRSSPGVERRFCETCGSPISFRSERMSGMMHFFGAALAEPEAFRPTMHVAIEEKLSWVELSDGLPTCLGPDYTKG